MLKKITVIAVVMLLFGCANPKQSFNPAANKHIQSIAVLTPVNPKEISVHVIHHPGMQFGLVGGLIAAADIASKTNQYQEAIAAVKINWAERAQARILLSLEKAGYKVTSLSIPSREPGKFQEEYEGAQVDAYLDYYFNISYAATTPTSDYTPSIFLFARLVDAKTKAILYEDRIAYGYQHKYGDPVHIPSSNVYLYNNIDILCEQGIKSLEPLKEGIHHAVDKVAVHLNKGLGVRIDKQAKAAQ